MSTRREAILAWLREDTSAWRMLYLSGRTGSGKTWLAQQLHHDRHRRVITLSLAESWQGKAAWAVIADNMPVEGEREYTWSRDTLGIALLRETHRTHAHAPLIIIENAHLNYRRVWDDIQRVMRLIPDGQFLFIGQKKRKVEQYLSAKGLEIIPSEGRSVSEIRDIIMAGHAIEQPDVILTAPVLKRLSMVCEGDCRKLMLAGKAISFLQQAEQTSSFTPAQWRKIYRELGDTRAQKIGFGGCLSGALIAFIGGWFALSSFISPLPVPAWLVPAPPVQVKNVSQDIGSTVMSDKEALSVLYGAWGYDVPADSAWCDQAVRAGLACKSGKASLQTLVGQNLPWIASLNFANKRLPVVVIRVGDDTLDVLIGAQTWKLTRKWFESAWPGDYLLLWKMSPEGENTIARDSSEEDILWLETILNRALHISTKPSAEWRPLLVEKIKQFQKMENLTVDGAVGPSTLMHLWQATGESAILNRDETDGSTGDIGQKG